ncbi:MAG: hypothetical protein ACK559_18720, partial [bacterium]
GRARSPGHRADDVRRGDAEPGSPAHPEHGSHPVAGHARDAAFLGGDDVHRIEHRELEEPRTGRRRRRLREHRGSHPAGAARARTAVHPRRAGRTDPRARAVDADRR